VQPASPRILTMNGGSSSIKFALFEAGEPLRRSLNGSIERIGLPGATFVVTGSEKFSRPLAVPNHAVAVNVLMDWLRSLNIIDRSDRLP
jgi:acetate kinase